MVMNQRFFVKYPITLVGFMCSGKTSVAKLLSSQTGIICMDSDKEIVNLTKKTVSEIINTRGIDLFRQIESNVIKSLVYDNKFIISTGGGCVEDALCRDVLMDTYCVWLDVSYKSALNRLEKYPQRPMFEDLNNAEKLYEKRKPLYEKCADLKIKTDSKSLGQVVYELKNKLLKEAVLQY